MSLGETASTISETITRGGPYETFELTDFPLEKIGFPSGFKAKLFKKIESGQFKEAFIIIYNTLDEPIAYVFHYLTDTEVLFDEDLGQAIAGKVVVDKDFRNGGRGLQLWKEAEYYLLQAHKSSDSVKRVILDMSGTNWTKKNHTQIFDHLKSMGVGINEITRVDEEGVFVVLVRVELESNG